MKIEALLFDLGKVLVNFNFEKGLQALHASCSISRDQFEAVLWDKLWVGRYESGEISTKEFHNYLCEAAIAAANRPFPYVPIAVQER